MRFSLAGVLWVFFIACSHGPSERHATPERALSISESTTISGGLDPAIQVQYIRLDLDDVDLGAGGRVSVSASLHHTRGFDGALTLFNHSLSEPILKVDDHFNLPGEHLPPTPLLPGTYYLVVHPGLRRDVAYQNQRVGAGYEPDVARDGDERAVNLDIRIEPTLPGQLMPQSLAYDEATVLTLGSTATGSYRPFYNWSAQALPYPGLQAYADFFPTLARLDVQAAETVVVDIDISGVPSVNTDVALYSREGQPVAGGITKLKRFGEGERLANVPLTGPGSYVLAIFGMPDPVAIQALDATFTMSVQASSAPQNLEHEPNNRPQSAHRLGVEPVSGLIDRPDDIDVFRLDRQELRRHFGVESRDMVVNVVATPVEGVDIEMSLLASDTTVIDYRDSGGVSEGESIVDFRLPSNDVFVRIKSGERAARFNPDSPYTLSVTARNVEPGQDLEPNNTSDQAIPISFDYETLILSGKVHKTNDVDIYRLDGFADDFVVRLRAPARTALEMEIRTRSGEPRVSGPLTSRPGGTLRLEPPLSSGFGEETFEIVVRYNHRLIDPSQLPAYQLTIEPTRQPVMIVPPPDEPIDNPPVLIEIPDDEGNNEQAVGNLLLDD